VGVQTIRRGCQLLWPEGGGSAFTSGRPCSATSVWCVPSAWRSIQVSITRIKEACKEAIRSWWRRGAGDALSGNAPRCPCSEHGDVVVLAPPLLAYQKRSPPSSHLLRIANRKKKIQTRTPAPGRDASDDPPERPASRVARGRMGSAVRLAAEVGLSRSFELHCRVTVELLSSYCRFFCRVVEVPDRGQGSRGRSQVRRGRRRGRPHSDSRPLGVGSLVGTGAHWRGRAHASVCRFGSSGIRFLSESAMSRVRLPRCKMQARRSTQMLACLELASKLI